MKATVGVYDSHEEAIEAVRELKNAGYPVKHLSIIGKVHTEQVDEEMHITEKYPINLAGIEISTVVGVTLGILTGVGLFIIPGVGFLFGAGALTGAIAGLDIGLMGGGIASLLINLGVDENLAKKYQADLNEGKYLVVAEGDAKELKQAKEMLSLDLTNETLETLSQ